MKVLFVSMITGNKFAGPSYSVPATIKEISRLAEVKWVNLDNRFTFLQSDFPNIKYISREQVNDKSSGVLKEILDWTDIVIFEDLYNIEFCKIARYLRKRSIPYIIVPRGGLCRAAQKKKRLKKFVANTLIFDKYVKGAAAIHYLTNNEYIDSGDSWNKEHFVIPNGVNIPETIHCKNEMSNVKGVFIGRIDIYHKGIDLLLKAIYDNKNYLIDSGCSIDIYGADMIGDAMKINDMIDSYKIEDVVKVHEPVYDEQKIDVLLNSDFFILTSRFEGHPTGLLEALSYGLPALVTYGSNMGEEIKQSEAGWVAEISEDSISDAIKEMLIDKDRMKILGINARKLAEQYSWPSVCKKIMNEVEKIVNTGMRE